MHGCIFTSFSLFSHIWYSELYHIMEFSVFVVLKFLLRYSIIVQLKSMVTSREFIIMIYVLRDVIDALSTVLTLSLLVRT